MLVELFVVCLYVVVCVGNIEGKCGIIFGVGLIGFLIMFVVCCVGMVDIIVVDIVLVLLVFVSWLGVLYVENVLIGEEGLKV